MTGWMRYPGNLAHHVARAKGVEGRKNGDQYRGVVTMIGRVWTTNCNRELYQWFESAGSRNPAADWVLPEDLRAERPRGFCLRCMFSVAIDAMVVDHRSLTRFAEAIESGGIPGLTWPEGLQ